MHGEDWPRRYVRRGRPLESLRRRESSHRRWIDPASHYNGEHHGAVRDYRGTCSRDPEAKRQLARQRTRGQLMRNSFWNCVAVKLMSAGISAGYSVMGLLDSGGDRLASDAASRSVALLISTLIRVWARSRTAHRHDQHTIATGPKPHGGRGGDAVAFHGGPRRTGSDASFDQSQQHTQ